MENITGEMLGWEARAESVGGTSGNVERESYDFIRAAVAARGRATEWVRRAWRRALCVTSEKGWYWSVGDISHGLGESVIWEYKRTHAV